ncbi:molybdopterin molybdotransferase MoeA [Aspergillus homomorphus CBS 101889]|uniref:molybdopterin adenylyltransferase n=1 Tax=Aspergillus homomorphus (strain CBS 101889) TaxID=1450537 RepID=A0A395HQ60_ASPHC|nr:molybdopterin biosynthesis enzyme [Aspergillus homomorphus CBS 101889]RAL09415.1 molybdopterin biosynthesis enzyme [Aspergillus homomorphus CBS 101889]
MSLSYREALDAIRCESERDAVRFRSYAETVTIYKAVNRISHMTYRCHESTPRFDTSAMDGYALSSAATRSAASDSPAIFRVCGTIAAGEEPLYLEEDAVSDIQPCVEIMTGAPFPQSTRNQAFDCCVRLEDVLLVTVSGYPCIKVEKQATFQQNRRLAGEDFSKGDILVSAGEVIQPSHIMALASAGVHEVRVIRRPAVGVISTGTELGKRCISSLHRIPDANGPYITASLQEQGFEVDFLGILEDNKEATTRGIHKVLNMNRYDILISSGAVSTGKFDFIPSALQSLQVRQVFHKILIRPGHPALFAKVPSARSALDDSGASDYMDEVPFFGLPGNPVASAACLQFLVVPYLRFLQGQPLEPVLEARAIKAEDAKSSVAYNMERAASQALFKVPKHLDVFRPGVINRHSGDRLEVTPMEHSSSKIKPFLGANCWIHIPAGVDEINPGDTVNIVASH